jgi:hypothetical protein
MMQTEDKQISLTDPDARSMATRSRQWDGRVPCTNCRGHQASTNARRTPGDVDRQPGLLAPPRARFAVLAAIRASWVSWALAGEAGVRRRRQHAARVGQDRGCAAMPNGHGIETRANKIVSARAAFGLAIRFYGEVEAGRITAEIYKRSVTILTDGDDLILPPFLEGNDQNLKDSIYNIVIIALGASALTLDDTLRKVSFEASTDGIRVMVRQLRNAFAHDPLRPKWRITRKDDKNRFPIKLDDGSKFTFDVTNLHGDQIKPEDVGGLVFWAKLLRHCEGLVGGWGDSHAS